MTSVISLKVLIAIIMLVLLSIPVITYAQPNVCGFYGIVRLDDFAVNDGTMVVALVDGVEMSSSVVLNSMYKLKVAGDHSDKTVTFVIYVDGQPITATTGSWMAGDNMHFDINAITPPPEAIPAEVSLHPENGSLTNICGEGFFPNRDVIIKWEEEVFAGVSAGEDGSFCVQLIPPVNEPGEYTIVAVAADNRNTSASAVFILVASLGEAGAEGPAGEVGEIGPPGSAGPEGEDKGNRGLVLSVAALIAVIISLVLTAAKNRKREPDST